MLKRMLVPEGATYMFKRILVPLDGSSRAERALPVAARIARASGGSVVLVKVLSIPIESQAYPILVQEVIDMELAEADAYLKSVCASFIFADVPVERVTLFGSAAPTILSVAESYQVDLIVLCSHGYTGVTRWMVGSVAEKLVRHAQIPVLILREGGPVPAGPHPDATRPLRVMVSLDGSALAKAALEPAASLIAALAAPAQGAMHLVRVVKPVSDSNTRGESRLLPVEQEQVIGRAKTDLRSTLEHLREGLVAPMAAASELTITTSVAVDTDVATALIRVAENGEDAEGAGVPGGCDIIAIATHGHGGIERWALGSVTERVLRATKLPLLIVRPPSLLDKSRSAEEKATVGAQD